ncbi:MAG: ATP-binding protein, partial [Actinomycetia bacterium]|nr:ATP-binding protein [Actinomycetes bacterium]
AFEGAQITGGQRATPGAIERVRIDRSTLEPRFRVIGSEAWSDEPGFGESIPDIGVTGICGSGIIEVIAEMFLAGVIDADGTIVGANALRSERVIENGRTFSYVLGDDPDAPLVITQNDVRAIQLAKAALRAGIDLLVEHAGSPEITDIRLAGAFGAHIDPVHAMVLGLVPDCPVDGVRSVGNAAGVGAVQALLSASARREMEDTAEGVVRIEMATEPRFQELFVAAMAFPHGSAPSPHLATVVELPEPATTTNTPPRRRRRSRT